VRAKMRLMENPVSPPKFRRTCPTCNRPVEPGYKFCETCGTKIPELSTCSKCGTQFITPVKYCDLCGAPVVLEVPEPADSTEHPEEEDNGQDEDQASERYEEEIPGRGTDELPEYPEEEDNGQDEDQAPERYEEVIPGPGTDEYRKTLVKKQSNRLRMRLRPTLKRKSMNRIQMNYRKKLVRNPLFRLKMRPLTTLKRSSRNRILMNYWNNSGRNMMTMRPWNPHIRQNPGLP